MGGKYTEAQRKASRKYIKEKTDEIKLRVPKGFKELVKQSADSKNKSTNKYIYDLIVSDIKQNEQDIL